MQDQRKRGWLIRKSAVWFVGIVIFAALVIPVILLWEDEPPKYHFLEKLAGRGMLDERKSVDSKTETYIYKSSFGPNAIEQAVMAELKPPQWRQFRGAEYVFFGPDQSQIVFFGSDFSGSSIYVHRRNATFGDLWKNLLKSLGI